MADKFFSLEIGENFIKLADIKKNGNIIEASSLGFLEGDATFYSSDNEKIIQNQAALIEKLLKSVKITKKNVSVIIPDSATYTQILTMPQLNEKELISAIKYQADQFIPMPIEEVNIDIEILAEDKAKKELTVMMVAAPRKLIEKTQNLIEFSGLIPDSIENEISSTGRFLSEFKNLYSLKSDDQSIIINFNYNSTSLYFFDSANYLIKEIHNFNIGYRLFLKEVQINTNYDLKQSQEILKSYNPTQKSSYDLLHFFTPTLNEFISEINRFITLIKEKHQSSIKSIYIFNEVSQLPSLSYFIQQSLSLPVKELNPYPICQNSPIIESHKNDLSLFVSTIGGNLR